MEAGSLLDKITVLRQSLEAERFLQTALPVAAYLEQAEPSTQLVLYAVIALGEGPVVLRGWNRTIHLEERLKHLASVLKPVEEFYDTIGGIVGYHATFVQLIRDKKCRHPHNEQYKKPPGIDISSSTAEVRQMIRWGIESLPTLAEIYPVGGAGDRLNLLDDRTKEPLPAAELRFAGRTLLETLLRDIRAREFLYEKLTGERLVTPIVLMTSHEKANDRRIKKILRDNQWFGRPETSFFFIEQPLVPVITIEGHWSLKEPFELYLKPGGHGAIWKLALDHGAFDWLGKHKRTKALVRQINNPIAGADYGLLAFAGIGCHQDKKFGFASCPRVVHTAEGMDVLVETVRENGVSYRLSNIEYTDFTQKGVEDAPEFDGSPFSKYPANTNLLFVDLETIKNNAPQCPVPGMIVNLKTKAPFISPEGEKREVFSGRLESTMQNISDCLEFSYPEAISDDKLRELPVYLTYHERIKTISVAKRAYEESKPLLETPEGCFYEMMVNHHELLSKYCKVGVPTLSTEELYLKRGPVLLFLFDPALGPIYSIIGQKIRGGTWKEGSEVQLEMSEVDIEDLCLEGSVIINGGPKSRCTLKNVQVKNRGIDREAPNVYWKNQITRRESLVIHLQDGAEFVAENIKFMGAHEIHVPKGQRWTAYFEKGRLFFHKETMTACGWSWKYYFDHQNMILLEKQSI